MTDDSLDPKLWKPRTVADTVTLYRDWAATYDADVLGSGYVTPTRAASALAPYLSDGDAILDFGCGTGLSGKALRDAGLGPVDGTDITPEMLELARAKELYRRLWLSEPGHLDVAPGTYAAILAAGVVSLGAAPPDTLDLLLDALAPGGLLAFSYNDPTLADRSYTEKLDRLLAGGGARLLFREHGPHLPEKGMGSDVILLCKA